MKPYPKYKDSGIKWIGNIPEHWRSLSVRRITSEHKQGFYSEQEYSDSGIKLLRITDIDDNSRIDYSLCPRVEVPENEFRLFILQRDDFVFARSGTIGRFGVVTTDQAAIFASYLIRFRFKPHAATGFLRYYFLSPFFKQALLSDLHGGANQNIHAENIKAQTLFLPRPDEQERIAEFLDTKTAEIDELIDKKLRQIELLKEYRTSIISEAVTKGLNPNVRMKDSGVKWIGEIPQHWCVRRLKHLLVGKLQYGANESAENDDPTMPRYIRITDFGDDGKLHDDTFKSLPMAVAKDYLLTEGDILFARSGATVGKTFQFKNYNGAACYAGYLIRAVPDPSEILSNYLYFFTRSNAYENWKNSSFSQATIQNIGADKYQNLSVSHPSIDEQAAIVCFLDVKTRQIDGLVERGERQIEQLQSYRTSLISEVVTGRIDVRDWNPTVMAK